MSRSPKMLAPIRTVSPDEASPSVMLTTLERLKTHCRIADDVTDEDDYLQDMIKAATEHLDGWEGKLSRALLTQNWEFKYDTFSNDGCHRIPFGPIQSVTVEYYDGNNALQTLPNSSYSLLEDNLSPFISWPGTTNTWPTIYDRRDAVKITAVAGYGDDSTSVPRTIRHAVLLIAAHWYEFREDSTVFALKKIPEGVDEIIKNNKAHWFGGWS